MSEITKYKKKEKDNSFKELLESNNSKNTQILKHNPISNLKLFNSRFEIASKVGRTNEQVIRRFKDTFENPDIVNNYIESLKSIYRLERKNWATGEIKVIKGLSIAVIKDIANIYSHLSYGVDYDLIGGNKVKAKAYCLDFYTNSSEERYFDTYLPKRICTLIFDGKQNAPDEVYKYVYQDGIRRMRVCIEHIVPFWLCDKAYKAISKSKSEFYALDKNTQAQFKKIFQEFQVINPKIKTLDDLSKFLGIQITFEKLKNPEFFQRIEELYIGYRDERGYNSVDDTEEKSQSRFRNTTPDSSQSDKITEQLRSHNDSK